MLNDKNEKKLFLEKEHRQEKIWIGFCFGILFQYLIGISMCYFVDKEFPYEIFIIFTSTVVFSGLVYTYKVLTTNLKEYHPKRYVEVKT